VQMWCGIDWAENHHDVSVVDEEGRQLVRLRIDDSLAGFSELASMLAEQQVLCEQPISVAIETSKGLLPAALRAAGVALVAINPLAVSRYRDRLSPSRSKSDAGDAFVLANILRTDPHNHRPLPVDSELAQAIQVLARAHQDAVWDRMQIANKLRSTLREYYPTFLAAFDDLASRESRATLHLAPTPGEGQRIRRASLTAALRRAGRSRGIPAAVEAIHGELHRDQLRQPARIEAAMAEHAIALLRALDTAVANVSRLEEQLQTAFDQHPDAEIITSFPGLGTVLGARILAEIGDDRTRFANARGLKAFAGTAPVTRSSGMKTVVTRRVVRNKRLGQAAYVWALPMLAHSPGAHAHFTARRERGDSYSAAARNLTNRGIGMLHHCLQSGQPYDEAKAFPNTTNQPVTSSRPRASKAFRETEASHARGNDQRRQAARDLYRASDHEGLSKDRGTSSLTT
jgi:transposase